MQNLAALGPVSLNRLTGLCEIVHDLPPFWFLDEALNRRNRSTMRYLSVRPGRVTKGRQRAWKLEHEKLNLQLRLYFFRLRSMRQSAAFFLGLKTLLRRVVMDAICRYRRTCGIGVPDANLPALLAGSRDGASQ